MILSSLFYLITFFYSWNFINNSFENLILVIVLENITKKGLISFQQILNEVQVHSVACEETLILVKIIFYQGNKMCKC